MFEPIRSLTMGGAHLGVADDDLAVFSNPAGIAKVKNPRVSFFDLQVEMGMTMLKPVSNLVTDIAGSKNRPFAEYITRELGKYHYYSASFIPHFVARNFAIHVLYRMRNAVLQTDPSILDVHARNDMGVLLSAGLPLFGGVLKMGATGKILHKAEMKSHTENGTTYSTLSTSGAYKEGLGFGVDVGTTLTIPIRFFPAFSVRARNLIEPTYETAFALYGGSGRPEKDERIYDAGYSMVFRIGNDSYVNLAFDVRNLTTFMDDYNASFIGGSLRHSHVGLEIALDRLFYIRAGAYQGYPAAGISLMTRAFALEIGAYGTEVGTVENRSSDYRFVTRFELGW